MSGEVGRARIGNIVMRVRGYKVDNRNVVALILLTVSCVMLFFGWGDYYPQRSFHEFWNLGHVGIFFLLTYLLLSNSKKFRGFSFYLQFISAVIVALLLGVLIEWLQTHFGRSASVSDVILDLTGAMLAVALCSPASMTLAKSRRYFIRITVIMAFMIQTYGLFRALTDEAIARWQFPVLSNFETPLELDRWAGDLPLAIEYAVVKQGKASLKVSLSTELYTGVRLQYLYPNWEGYTKLLISVYSTLMIPVKLQIRVHDLQHVVNSFPYHDRYRGEVTMKPGWNNYVIPIESIIHAPKTHVMDIHSMNEIMIFFPRKLHRPGVMYIDEVRLAK